MTTQNIWERDTRSFVYLHERRTRYPSIARTKNGNLLGLFTRQTEEQENKGIGDLLLVRRSLDGKWWMRPEVVFEGLDGEPRAAGTMTTLSSGCIIAPFVLLRDADTTSELRVLISADDGESWFASQPISQKFLVWGMPNGRPFELNGSLVMPVFGALSKNDLLATRHCCGLLRSFDNGKTWEDWSLIAYSLKENFSFEYPALLPLKDGSLVAILTARRLARGIDAPQVLMRCFSEDGGLTWTEPEQLCVGAWPCLASVDENTTVCAYTVWSSWGEMRLLVSYDGFKTFKQDQPFVEHGWLPIPESYPKEGPIKVTHVEQGRPYWAYQPIPLPPVVPYLGGDWDAGHYGFPTALTLSEERFIVLLGNRQKGSVYTNPSREREMPIEPERIEAITFERLPAVKKTAPRVTRAKMRDRWEIASSWTPDEWREKAEQPPSGVSLVLKSGRWLRVTSEMVGEYHEGTNNIVGCERGYWVFARQDGLHYRCELRASYSDDQGRTWIDAKLASPVPLASAVHPAGDVFEDFDGTIIAPFYGYFNDQDMSCSLYVSALCRSHDGGLSWGDWSIIGYDKEQRFSAYSETAVLPMPSGVWVAFMRTEVRTGVPFMGGMISRAISTDRGYTWTSPEICFPGSQSAAVVLPDGGIVSIVRTHSRQASGVYFSYDLGNTWNYALAGPYNTQSAAMLDENHFWVYAGNEVVIYRKVNKRL